MELLKKNIHMDRIKAEAVTQIALEDDMNIPENKPDVDSINLEKGQVVIEEVKAGTDCVNIRGVLIYSVLYHTLEEGCSLVALEGKLPFDERLNMQGVTAQDQVSVSSMVEDLNVGIINSRKLSIQSLLTLQAKVCELYDVEAPIGIHGEEWVEYCKVPMDLAQIAISKNDIFRMKEEISMPSNYPNIFQILWSDISLGEMEYKLLEEKISLQGEVRIFVLYEGEGEEHPIRSFETTLPVKWMLECHGCREGMLPDISCIMGQQELTIRPDFDGEERNLGLELVLDIVIKLYQEDGVEILTDIYGVTKEVECVNEATDLRRLLAKVTGKTKVTEHVRIEKGSAPILQLLHSEARVSLDHQCTVENGILLQGGLRVKVMYITGNDESPYMCTDATLPYQYTLDVPGIAAEDLGKVNAEVEALQVSMLDGEEMDVKAVLSFTTTVFQNIPMSLISRVKISDIDSAKLSELPGMVIIMVHEGDNLWNIGRKYYVPVNTLRELNGLSSDELKPGQKLMIVKGA